MIARVIDDRVVRWGPASHVDPALIVIQRHSKCTRVFQYLLLSPRQIPYAGGLIE